MPDRGRCFSAAGVHFFLEGSRDDINSIGNMNRCPKYQFHNAYRRQFLPLDWDDRCCLQWIEMMNLLTRFAFDCSLDIHVVAH